MKIKNYIYTTVCKNLYKTQTALGVSNLINIIKCIYKNDVHKTTCLSFFELFYKNGRLVKPVNRKLRDI